MTEVQPAAAKIVDFAGTFVLEPVAPAPANLPMVVPQPQLPAVVSHGAFRSLIQRLLARLFPPVLPPPAPIPHELRTLQVPLGYVDWSTAPAARREAETVALAGFISVASLQDGLASQRKLGKHEAQAALQAVAAAAASYRALSEDELRRVTCSLGAQSLATTLTAKTMDRQSTSSRYDEIRAALGPVLEATSQALQGEMPTWLATVQGTLAALDAQRASLDKVSRPELANLSVSAGLAQASRTELDEIEAALQQGYAANMAVCLAQEGYSTFYVGARLPRAEALANLRAAVRVGWVNKQTTKGGELNTYGQLRNALGLA